MRAWARGRGLGGVDTGVWAQGCGLGGVGMGVWAQHDHCRGREGSRRERVQRASLRKGSSPFPASDKALVSDGKQRYGKRKYSIIVY